MRKIADLKERGIESYPISVAMDYSLSEVKKLFKTIAPKYADRTGGYTRVLKLGARKSDGAEMAQIEFV